MSIRRELILLFFVFLMSCSSSENGQQFSGAGLNLYTPQTSQETDNIILYLDELCRREGRGAGCTGTGNYSAILDAGFNDITKRCNSYILWIDRQRIEAQMFNRSLASTQGLLAGLQPVVKISADALAGLLAVFSFSEEVYEIRNLNVLAAFETSAIKLVVEKRLGAIRQAAANAPPFSRSKVIEYLETYLVQCTPTFIAANFNEDVRNPDAGTPEALVDDFSVRLAGRTPKTRDADDLLNSRGAGTITSSCPQCFEIYDENFAEVTNLAAVKLSQTRLCVTGDGIVSSDTLAAIDIFEASFGGEPVIKNGKLNEQENTLLSGSGCKTDADRAAYRNVYESSSLNPNINPRAAESFGNVIDGLNRKLDLIGTNEEITLDNLSGLNARVVREAIAKARGPAVCNQPIDAPKDKKNPMEQLTLALVSCLRSN